MIRAEFVIQDSKILSFSLEGHAGLAPAPHDVLCASVSAMALLTVNTVTEIFGAKADLVIAEEKPLISMTLSHVPEENILAVEGVLRGLLLQLSDLEEQYPKHLKIRTKK